MSAATGVSTSCSHIDEEGFEDSWFDRSICPEPCGSMHTYCNRCGQNLDYCALISEKSSRSLWRRLRDAWGVMR